MTPGKQSGWRSAKFFLLLFPLMIFLGFFAFWTKPEVVLRADHLLTPLKELEQREGIIFTTEQDVTEDEVAVETSAEVKAVSLDSSISHDVPFTPQAPRGQWADSRQQNACEEAAVLMAMAWVRGESVFDLASAEEKIIAITEFEKENYGHHHDVSAADTVVRIFKGYFDYNNVELKKNIGTGAIKEALAKGNLVIVPVAGRKLGNPYFTPPGPIEHMIVVIGYDADTKEFITNDPGTSRGKSFRYQENILAGALRDYPTGYHEPINSAQKNMIVVRK